MAVTRVHHIPNPQTVPVSPTSGQFLFFRITDKGPGPRFSFATDIKGQLLNQGTFPGPPSTKRRMDLFARSIGCAAVRAPERRIPVRNQRGYRCHVSLHGPAGLIRDVLDIEYTGTPTDFDTEVFES